MNTFVPVPSREGLLHEVIHSTKRFRQARPGFVARYLPVKNVTPEHVGDYYFVDVEVLLTCIQHGAWVGERDWRTIVRYALAKRLRVRQSYVFHDSWADIKDTVLEYQLHGGNFKMQDSIRKRAALLMTHPKSTRRMVTTARLFLSLTDDNITNTLIQPFHWIRAVVASTEINPVYAMTLYNAEARKQKLTLYTMLRARVQ